MKKLPLILGIIALVVIIGGVILYTSITGSPTTPAFIQDLEGGVTVNGQPAVVNQELKLQDTVKTTDGTATLVLQESIFVSVFPNSEVTIEQLTKDNIKIKQDGDTWNKFTHLTGVATFAVETPNTVATVRGTGFKVSADDILVGEGVVEVMTSNGKISVTVNEKSVYKDGKLSKEELTDKEKSEIKDYLSHDKVTLRKLIWYEVSKKQTLYDKYKSQYGFTDSDANKLIDDLVSGKISFKEIEEKSPVNPNSLAGYTKIKNIVNEINK